MSTYHSLRVQRIEVMRPEHEARHAIIREWMRLPKDQRRSEQQAAAFAAKVAERVPSTHDPRARIMRWLLPRIAKS